MALALGDRVYDYAVRAWEDGDITEYLRIPRWPVVGLITLAIFSAAVVSVLRALSILTKPSADYQAESEMPAQADDDEIDDWGRGEA